MEQLVDILGVEVVAVYRLRLTFADGTVGDVDFAAREWRGVFEPLGELRRDPPTALRSTGGAGDAALADHALRRTSARRSMPGTRLEEAVGEEEMDDALSQLPGESRSMLPRA